MIFLTHNSVLRSLLYTPYYDTLSSFGILFVQFLLDRFVSNVRQVVVSVKSRLLKLVQYLRVKYVLLTIYLYKNY